MLDMLVVGGGINGAGIARDAAGRGLSVALCEQDDLAAHTSSASSKLIHGGLRYLEHREFALVRRSLAERETLLRLAPHLVRPLSFVLPHAPHLRPAWQLGLGLWLYDRLAGRRSSLPRSRRIRLDRSPLGTSLHDGIVQGFSYTDAQVADARLVVVNAMDAAARGACIWTRTTCEQAWREHGSWTVDLRDADGTHRRVQALTLVNATGPWASTFTDSISLTRSTPLRRVQGSHVVVPALFPHDHAYLLQQPDGRIVFAIPFEERFTLIGTTDVEFDGDPAEARIDEAQVQYLCAAANRSFCQQISQRDIVWSFSGVRPLLQDANADASEVSRDYRLDLDTPGAPLLNVLGGKLTTYRRLAEQAVDLLVHAMGRVAPAWTATGEVLPGGELGAAAAVQAHIAALWPWLPDSLAARWACTYGSRTSLIVGNAEAIESLGEHFGADLYQAELEYLFLCEWARSADDVLWRRTRLGLVLDDAQKQRLAHWMTTRATTDGNAP